jgi:transcriptional regulator GlxA family with amidase domain
VCTGSWLLAATGCLRGEKATTNKIAFNECKVGPLIVPLISQELVAHNAARCTVSLQQSTAEHGVNWIPKARFVVSNKFWTASGVTAGMDMACAWIESLVGSKDAERVQSWAEYT